MSEEPPDKPPEEPPVDEEQLQAEEAEMRDFLDEALSAARLSRNEVDQKLGLARGETGRILRGQRRLTVRHVFMLAGMAGMDAEQALERYQRRRAEKRRAVELMRRHAPKPSPDLEPSALPVDIERFQQLITAAVEEVFDRRGRR